MRVQTLRSTGLGYQRIAVELGRLGVATSRGSVERLVKGLPPYAMDSTTNSSPNHHCHSQRLPISNQDCPR